MDASSAPLNGQGPRITESVSRVRIWPWRYSSIVSVPRDLRLDFLRGYCIFSMVVDHATGPNNWLYSVTGKSQLTLVTGANGFVLISCRRRVSSGRCAGINRVHLSRLPPPRLLPVPSCPVSATTAP